MTTQEVLNYGGGWQTTGMLELVKQGQLPQPDRIVIADTGRERKTTWRYLESTARPRMAEIGLEIEIAPRSLAYIDIYAHNGDLLLPVYTLTGKLSAFCSSEWKARVIERYLHLTELGHSPADIEAMTRPEVKTEMKRPTSNEYRNWIGFTFDERKRIKGTEGRWFPLVEKMITKEDNRLLLESAGWPNPTSSSCWMCANLDNAEWRDIRDNDPADFDAACLLDEEIRENDLFNGGSGIWLHHSRVPLREADLEAVDRKGPARQCGLGMCFI